MAIRTVVTRGYGNGTFDGSTALVATRGYLAGAAVVPPPAPAVVRGGGPIFFPTFRQVVEVGLVRFGAVAGAEAWPTVIRQVKTVPVGMRLGLRAQADAVRVHLVSARFGTAPALIPRNRIREINGAIRFGAYLGIRADAIVLDGDSEALRLLGLDLDFAETALEVWGYATTKAESRRG